MKKLTISVPNMQSTHCKNRVNNAVKEVEGVQVESIEAGKLTVSFSMESQEKKIISAIENAGYAVSKGKDNHV